MVSGAIAIRQPIRVHIRWGKARGLEQVKTALAAALSAAFLYAINETIALMTQIVPESAADKGRYEPKTSRRRKKTKYGSGYAGYLRRRRAKGDQESLLDTALEILTAEKRKISALTGMDIGRQIGIKFGYPSSYASFINLKRNVRWSKGGSKTGFYGKTKQRLINTFRAQLREELSKQTAIKLSLTKYIGTRAYG